MADPITPVTDVVAVGAVSADSARIWLRSATPGERHLVRVRGADGSEQTVEVEVPAAPERDRIAVATVGDLAPAAKYDFTVVCPEDAEREERALGGGSFHTAPRSGNADPFAIAVMSCHQPFDDGFAVRDDARAMLRAALAAMRERDTRLVLMIGDQLYADAPRGCSLFDEDWFREVAPAGRARLLDCTAEEVRALYQERYRRFWALPEWQEILASYPCYPMLDDHEVVDNWGSDPAHATAEWSAVREGAMRAYQDYQGSRVRGAPGELPEWFRYVVEYGDVAVFLTDMRTHRAIDEGRLFGPEQLAELRAFLEGSVEKAVVLVVTTVPLFHVPEIATCLGAFLTGDGDDFSDRAVHPAYRAEFEVLCGLLREQRRRAPEQRFVLVSGDIHVGAISALQWDDEPESYQLIASGITHESGFVGAVSKLAVQAAHVVPTTGERGPSSIRLLDGENPYAALHLGFVEVGGAERDVRLSLYGEEDGRPRRVARSDPF